MKKSNIEVSFLDTSTYSKRPFTNHCYVDVTVTSSRCRLYILWRHIPTGQCSSTPSTRNSCFTFSRDTRLHIPPWLWPPNSPDLNPVDYPAWSVLEQRVYRTRIRDITSRHVWLQSGRSLTRISLT